MVGKDYIRHLTYDLKKMTGHVIYDTRVLLRIQKTVANIRNVILHVGNIHW